MQSGVPVACPVMPMGFINRNESALASAVEHCLVLRPLAPIQSAAAESKVLSFPMVMDA